MNSLASIFLSRRVKLIVTSERHIEALIARANMGLDFRLRPIWVSLLSLDDNQANMEIPMY